MVLRFHKKHNKHRDERYFLEIDIQYPEELHGLNNDLSFLPERMKNLKNLKVKKLVGNFHDKKEYIIHKKFKISIKSWISI